MKRILLSLALSVFTVLGAFSQNFYIQENFNNSSLPTGWSNNAVQGTNTWQFGIDAAVGTGNFSTGTQNIDGTALAYFDDDVFGANDSSTVELTTPAFDNSGIPQTTLEFDYNFKEFTGIADSFYVDVYDGTNWVRVFSVNLDDCGHYKNCGTFPHAVIDISTYANSNCQVRFTYHDGNDWGWYVGLDNVEIYSPVPNDLQVSEIIEPISGCGLGNDSVKVKVKNIGFNSASNFDVVFDVDNGTQVVSETVSSIIAAGDSLIYTFNGLANLNTVQTYSFKAYTDYTADGATFNDSAFSSVQNEPNYNLTYTEGFENSNHNWRASGVNSTWQRGTPSNTIINSAAGGSNAFVTDLNGPYNNNEFSFLTSPCLDFSSATTDPILSFSLIHQFENGFDYIWLEYSIDNGVTWNRLAAHPTFTPQNWYNDPSNQRWTGQSGGWLQVENTLNNLGGQSQVKLRFAIITDGSTNLEGAGIDNISIRERQDDDVSLNAIAYPTSGGSPLCGYGTENIIVDYENKGNNPVTTLYFAYQVDGGTIRRDTVTGTNVAPGQILTYQFTQQYNFSAVTNYSLRAWVTTPNDGFTFNDTSATVTVTNSQTVNSVSLPYRQNFDAMIPGGNFNQGWVANPAPSPNAYSWNLSAGGTPNVNTGPDADCSGNNFAFLEPWFLTGPDPTITSPCINLSQNQGARLTFCYHKYGANMGPLFVDAYDGVSWNTVDVINGQTQFSGADPWITREVNLNAYAGRRIKVRFRGRRGGTLSDMAVDNVFIFEPLPRDVEMLDVKAPLAGCEISDSSEIVVEIYNPGTLDTKPDSIQVSYQVDGGPVVTDTVDFIILSETSQLFSFSQTANLGNPNQIYSIKTWTDMVGDQNDVNDTIESYEVKNQQKSPNYYEDFETFRDALCDQPLGQVMEEGWFAPQTEFGWNVQKSTCGKGGLVTPTAGTGPSGDHTSGRGIFLYTESINIDGENGINNSEAIVQSPCIDFSGQSTARMSFWYHKYGAEQGDLFVDVFANGVWTLGVDQISGQTQNSPSTAWKVRHVNLDSFAGDLAQVRFRGTRIGSQSRGDMAIDDIYIYQAIPEDVGINVVSSPSGDNCTLGLDSVKLTVENFGTSAIAANTVEVSYSINNGPSVVDTIPDAIPVNGTATFRFPGTIDMSTPGNKDVVVTTRLTGDTIRINNRYVQKVYNRNIGLPRTFEDFEADGNDGWTRFPTNNYRWQRICEPSNCIDGCQPPNPIPPNGPNGDHTFASPDRNGDGCYWVIESGFKTGNYPDARLNFPCGSVDFSNSQNNRILLNFWYHRFGDPQGMGDLFIDVHNGQQWVNGVSVIRGTQQGDDADPWQYFQVSLDQFAGVTNGNIRFRAQYNGVGGNMAIDDVELIDRATHDLSMVRFKDPRSDCGLSNQERVRVEVQNTGITDIFQLDLCYQITYTPLGGQPVTSDPVCDQRVGILISGQNRGARYTFEFPTRADMTQPGRYEFKVWGDQVLDAYAFNDTITAVVTNETRPFPYCTDFSDWTYGWVPKDFEGGELPTAWIGNREAYSFKSWLDDPTAGHTRGLNDVYLLANDGDGMPGQWARIESPCFDLTNTPTANLEFWYKAPMDGDTLFIDIQQGNAPWREAVDTIYTGPIFNWRKFRFSLADFVGDFVKIRFRSLNAGGYYAIDDLCIVRPSPQQVELETIVIPPMNFCQYLSDEIVTYRIQNTGLRGIDSFRVVLAVDTGTQKFPPGEYFRDTMWVFRGIHYNNFEPGDKIDFPLDSFPINMVAKPLRYFFFAHVFLPGDPDTTDNFIELYEVLHPFAEPLPYITDFEDAQDPYNGWAAFQTNPMGYSFSIWQGAAPNALLTGPSDDHTRQNGTGRYFLTDATAGEQNDVVVLFSGCIDLSQAVNPEISYWYHRFGSEMGTMYLEVNDDFGWDRVETLLGQDQVRSNDPWQNSIVDLSQYAGDFVRMRFVSFRGRTGSVASDMGLDDIAIYDLPPLDVAPDSLCNPTEDINSCYLVNQPVEVRVRNNGGDSIDFTVDSAEITVGILRQGVPWDTLTRTLNVNEWINPDNDLAYPLPPDSSVCVLMDGTFDMYHIGETFTFNVNIDLPADVVNSNDSDSYDVFTREEGGNISVVVNPNDTVCSGESVALTLENYFGRLSWQERTINPNDTGFWVPGNAVSDRSVYVSNPDTITYYRVWVCNNVYSTVDSVVAIKPYSIDTVRASKCAGDPNALTVNVTVPDNIEKVYLYERDVRKYFFDNLITDSTAQAELRRRFADTLNTLGWVDNNVNGFVPSNNVVRIRYTRPLSTNRDTTYLDTLYLETFRLGCYSLSNIPLIVTVEPAPRYGNLFDVPALDTLCTTFDDNKGELLNAGSREGFIYSYSWEIKEYDLQNNLLSTTFDTLQTVTVDPWQLEKNRIYTFQATVNTPNNCGAGTMSPLITRLIDDKCFVGLEERDLSDKMDIYPNPTSENLFIRYRTKDELKGNISLRDLSGKIILERINVRLNDKIEKIELNDLPKGVYFLQIDTDKGRVIEKIVKS